MPLLTPGLILDLNSLFSEPPEGFVGCATQWGDAIQAYTVGIIPPSTTVAVAVLTLKTALATAFETGQAEGTGAALATQLELAFAVFALTISGGMVPAFIGAPPTAPMGWAAALAEDPPSTHSEAANKYSDLIDTWMKTGTAVPSIGGDSVNWS